MVELAARVATLRRVDGRFAPPCRSVTRVGLRQLLDAKLRRDLPVAPELYLEALVRTGFADGQPAAIYQNLLEFYSSQVLGFYEPDGDAMILLSDPPSALADPRLVWCHELEHAAQQHRFGLPRRLLAMHENGDAQRAASAVAEGEAMLVMFLVTGPAGGGDQALRGAEAAMVAASKVPPTPQGVPEYFVSDLVFPYTTGFSAVLASYRGGGWNAVDRLLADPPASTAVLLHPDRQTPSRIVTPDSLPSVPAGWREVLTDAVGEWGLEFLLSRRIPRDDATRLAAGWDGDRIRLVRAQADPTRWGLVWRIGCRPDVACQALHNSLARVVPSLLARLPGPAPLELVWVTGSSTLELRASWPRPSAPQ
jgi:hypothetical protein